MDRRVQLGCLVGGTTVLPFHKRSRATSSIEIGTDELEAIELPPVRPPSVRPSVRPSMIPSAHRHVDDDEMTIVRSDRRLSSSPPPSSRSAGGRMPAIPRAPLRPRFNDDEEPTLLARSALSRPLLSMSARNIPVDQSGPAPLMSQARLDDEPPPSSRAVDPSASGVLRDLSMTSSVSADVSKLRPRGPAWAVGFVALGVLAGLVVAFAARGEGLAAAAALVDPSRAVAADNAKAPQQVQPMAPGAAIQATSVVDKNAAPSCNADAVAAAVVAKVEARGSDVRVSHVEHVEHVEPVEHKTVAQVERPTYVAPIAPRPVVHHVDPPPAQPTQVVAQATPPPPVARPTKARKGDDLESASAADALAKAQLEASLSR
jgi:hypothetical protein